MSALELVPSWGGDAMPDGVSIEPATYAGRFSTRSTAQARAERIRGNVAQLVADLVDAWREHDDAALGFATFGDYATWLFGDVSRVSIPTEARRELVAGMTERDGLSIRRIAGDLGVSPTTVAADRKVMLHPEALVEAQVIEHDDAEQLAQLDPYRGLSPRWAALAMVAAEGERGLTSTELVQQLDAAHDTAHASLSKLASKTFVTIGTLSEARANRRPYRVTEIGRARLCELLAARDAAESGVSS